MFLLIFPLGEGDYWQKMGGAQRSAPAHGHYSIRIGTGEAAGQSTMAHGSPNLISWLCLLAQPGLAVAAPCTLSSLLSPSQKNAIKKFLGESNNF